MKLFGNADLLPALLSLQRAIFYSSALSFYAIMAHRILDFPYVAAGEVIFLMVSSGSVFQIIAGKLSDKVGRRRIVFLGQVTQGLSLIVMGDAFLHLYIFPSIFGFLLAGIGGNSVQSSVNAVVADTSVSTGSTVENFAKIRTAVNSGFGFGPLLTGMVLNLNWVSYGVLLELMGVMSLVFLFLIPMIQGKGTARSTMNHPAYLNLNHRYLIELSLSAFLISIVFGQLTSSVPVYEELINHLTLGDVGMLLGLNGFVIVLTQYPISKLVKNTLNWKWMTGGSAIYSIFVILLSVANTFYGILLTVILITLGEAIFWATAQALITSISKPAKYGENLGIWAFSVNMGRGAGAEYGLTVFSLLVMNHTLMWFTIAVPGLMSAMWFGVLVKRISREIRK